MGSIPIGPTVRWLFCDLDPRLGRAASAFVPPLNALKGFVPTIIAFHGGGEIVGLMAAFACTLGHYYCPWRHFRGGRSADLIAGVVLALSPAFGGDSVRFLGGRHAVERVAGCRYRICRRALVLSAVGILGSAGRALWSRRWSGDGATTGR